MGRSIGDVHVAVVVLVVLAPALSFIPNRTVRGRYIFAVGGNEEAMVGGSSARQAGASILITALRRFGRLAPGSLRAAALAVELRPRPEARGSVQGQ